MSLRERARATAHERYDNTMTGPRPGLSMLLDPALVIAYPGAWWTEARARWAAWTVLPGDHFYDARRMVTGEVTRVHRPGVVDMLEVTRGAQYRHGMEEAFDLPRVDDPDIGWVGPDFAAVRRDVRLSEGWWSRLRA